MTEQERKKMDREIRRDFPILTGDYAYLDNAATTQKPVQVLNAVDHYYRRQNANPLRGLYRLSVEATEAYENAREAVRRFINAEKTTEIVFTRNATESLNLVAYSWCSANLKEGDEIAVTIMEHHSNFLPWLTAAQRVGAKINFIEPEQDGLITEEIFRNALTPRTRIVAMTQVSNVLGRENPIKKFAKIAHDQGALFVADGAQSVPHMPVDVRDLDVDFLAFSGHKMLAPMGIGVLYGKEKLFEEMPPFMTGGEMIEYVRRDGFTTAELPHKFEAGTVNAGGAVGLHAAIDYYNKIGFDAIVEREEHLTAYAMKLLAENPHVHIIGSDKPEEHHGILTFTLDGVHPHDVATILDEHNVDIRAGHHCAQPLMKFLHTPSTTRASIAFYNTEDDIERLAEGLKAVRQEMGYTD